MKDKEPVTVRLQSAALDERNGEIVAHGWLDIEALQNLRVGDYQREILESRNTRSTLRKAVENGERLPDIMLGMRGQKYMEGRAGAMMLENDVYIIDGLQRVSALRKFAADHPERASEVRIGAEVRFATTRDSETELFTVLNTSRKAMSASVILRNQRNHNDAVATLYGLSMHDSKFAMIGKVCWDQQMHRGELMTALTFAKAAMTLHRHTATGGRHLSTSAFIPRTLETMIKNIGLQNFRNNLQAFYEVIDEVWGVRGLKYTDRATHLRANFVIQLAGVFSDHEDFWDGNRLMLDAGFRAKLKSFPIEDPTIIRLSGAGTMAGELLRRHIIDFLNRNKQVANHLTIRRMEPFRKSKASRANKKKAA